MRNLSHIATVILLIVAIVSKKVQGSVILNRIGMKFSKIRID